MSDMRNVTDAELQSACDAAERNYRMACAGGDEQTTVEAALDYIHAAYLVPDTRTELFAPFTHVVRVMDSQPSWWSREFTDPVLWAYKWVVRCALATPDVSLTGVAQLIDGMERRYQEHGQSMRPVVKMRMIFAEECYGVDAAADFFHQWQSMDTSRYCDCPECEPTLLLGWYARTGQDDLAASLALEVMQGHIEAQCMDQPQEFYACAIEPLLVAGHTQEASWVQRMSYRLDKQRPNRFNLLTHADVLARSGNFSDALAFLSQAALKPAASPRGEAFGLAMAACALKFGPENAPEREYWPGYVGTPQSVSEDLFDSALQIGARFDDRNESTATTDGLRWVLSRPSLPDLAEVSSPATVGTGFAQLDSDLAGDPPGELLDKSEQSELPAIAADKSFALSSSSTRNASSEVFAAIAESRKPLTDLTPWDIRHEVLQSLRPGNPLLKTLTLFAAWREMTADDPELDIDSLPDDVDTDTVDAVSFCHDGAFLDCLGYFFGGSLEHVARAEQTATKLGYRRVADACEVIRLCQLKSLEPDLLARLRELSSSKGLVTNGPLAMRASGVLFRAFHRWGLDNVPDDFLSRLRATMGYHPNGKIEMFLVELEADVWDVWGLFPLVSECSKRYGHRPDLLYRFCATAALGFWTEEDGRGTVEWLHKADSFLRETTSAEYIHHCVELLVRSCEKWPSVSDSLADLLVRACRHGALLQPAMMLYFVGRCAETLQTAGRNLDLLELGEMALAQQVDPQWVSSPEALKARKRLLLQVREQMVSAAHSLHEYQTAITHASAACEDGSEDPFAWLIYSLEANDNNNSLEVARRLAKAGELCWDARDAVGAVQHLSGLVLATYSADGADRARATVQEWQDRIDSVEKYLPADMKTLADVRVSSAWAAFYDAVESRDESITWRNKALTHAEASGQPGEMVTALALLSSSYSAAERFSDAEITLDKLSELFPDCPTTPEVRDAVGHLMSYFSSSGRGAEADVLLDRFGL